MINIWPNTAPGSEGLNFQEEILERSSNPETTKDRVVSKILNPTLTAYVPEKPNGTGILVIPGGGFLRLAIDKEGADLAPWLNELGVTYFVLRHRLPGEGHKNKEVVPLQDAQRALRYIRYNATKWNLDPGKIGVLGFSSGGYLAASLSTKYDEKVYEKVDKIDEVSARPDFQILGYPVITMLPPFAHEGTRKVLLGKTPSEETLIKFSLEKQVHSENPPAFIMAAFDDKVVPVENPISYCLALKNQGVSTELHIFKDGGHGYAIREAAGKSAAIWTELLTNWMRCNKLE